ncbi:MAG: hypothetical protein RDU59_12880, partial [Thermodesulfobacteriota bacterium]|nr:hypothetical protein [Thermodesulfobacteriota bacterium]
MGLIKYETSAGRGKTTEFEIIEPLNTPLPEKEVYRIHPRLRSKSYNKKLSENSDEAKKDMNHILLERKSEKDTNHTLFGEKKDTNHTPLENEKDTNHTLFGEKKDTNRTPIKKIYIKRQQQNDLSHESGFDHGNAAYSEENLVVSPVVVALDDKMLKEYGIAGEMAKTWLKKYSPAFLLEKIEILEYKLYKGEAIKNRGGMLKKAVEQDWQPPEGFSTRTQREEAARREREEREAEVREAAAREEREKRERELALAAEEWKKTAPSEEREKINKRALKEVMAENPGIEEKL